jgi:hypothetical protein
VGTSLVLAEHDSFVSGCCVTVAETLVLRCTRNFRRFAPIHVIHATTGVEKATVDALYPVSMPIAVHESHRLRSSGLS